MNTNKWFVQRVLRPTHLEYHIGYYYSGWSNVNQIRLPAWMELL